MRDCVDLVGLWVFLWMIVLVTSVDVGQPELCKSEEGKHACVHCSRILYIIIL